MKKNIKNLIAKVKSLKTYNEMVCLQFDLDFLENANDESIYALNQLYDKMITPDQFKVIVVNALSR